MIVDITNTDTKMKITLVLDIEMIGTAIITPHDCTESTIETAEEMTAETTTVTAIETDEKIAIAEVDTAMKIETIVEMMTEDNIVATTRMTTNTERGRGIRKESAIEIAIIEMVGEPPPTGLLHAVPLTTTVGPLLVHLSN